MNMKKQRGSAVAGLIAAIAVILVIGYVLCWVFLKHSIVAENGVEVVIVDKPYFWGHEGVRKETLKPGSRSVEWRTTDGIEVPITPLTVQMQFEDLPTSDNVLLDFSTSLQVQVTDARELIVTKGANWFANNLQQPWSSEFRDQTKAHTMKEIMTDPKVAALMEKNLLEALTKRAATDGIAVRITDFNMGRGKPNPAVQEKLDATAAEQQRSTTLDATIVAEGKRATSEAARALADKAYADAMNYSPEQVVQLAAINAYAEACKKEGTNCVIMAPGANPVIGVGK